MDIMHNHHRNRISEKIIKTKTNRLKLGIYGEIIRLHFRRFFGVVLIGIIFSAITIPSVPVLAQVAQVTPAPTLPPTQEERALALEQQRLTSLRQRADSDINRLIINLTVLINKAALTPGLTSEQRAGIISNIQIQIDELRAIRLRIQNENSTQAINEELARAKELVNRTNLYYNAAFRILVDASRVIAEADALTETLSSLVIAVSEAKAKGQNLVGIEAIIAEIQRKINEARTKAENANELLLQPIPSDGAGVRARLDTARAEVRSAGNILRDVRRDGKAAVNELVKLYREQFKF